MSPTSEALDRLDAAFEGDDTGSQVSRAGATALGLLLLVAQYGANAQFTVERSAIQLPGLHQESAQTLSPISLSELDVLNALLELHERLVATQQELPSDAKDLLYGNLWRLYD